MSCGARECRGVTVENGNAVETEPRGDEFDQPLPDGRDPDAVLALAGQRGHRERIAVAPHAHRVRILGPRAFQMKGTIVNAEAAVEPQFAIQQATSYERGRLVSARFQHRIRNRRPMTVRCETSASDGSART